MLLGERALPEAPEKSAILSQQLQQQEEEPEFISSTGSTELLEDLMQASAEKIRLLAERSFLNQQIVDTTQIKRKALNLTKSSVEPSPSVCLYCCF